MIDTDKYEGHTEGKRELKHNAFIHIEGRGLYATVAGGFTTADRLLMADAPLLLAEVKRLRGRHVAFMQWMLENYDEIVNEWEASDITEASE